MRSTVSSAHARSNAVVTCERKLFQNYFRSVLQLTNIFQYVQIVYFSDIEHVGKYS